MTDEELEARVQAATDAAVRASGFARAALMIAVTALAIGVLGLALPLP